MSWKFFTSFYAAGIFMLLFSSSFHRLMQVAYSVAFRW
uniref:Uncharacterized protein n=1 Tax=Rhizophora mucronata TaxID=61149 RepID=A0A2P2PNM9_RHIMU